MATKKKTNQNTAEAEADRRVFARSLKEQEKVSVQISPLYQPYFGKVMTVTIQGVSVAVPVDGMSYEVPATFAAEVNIRKYRQDMLFKKKRKMSNVTGNFESSPGELQLF